MQLIKNENGTFTLEGLTLENIKDMYGCLNFAAISTAYRFLTEADEHVDANEFVDDYIQKIEDGSVSVVDNDSIRFDVGIYKQEKGA